MVLCSRCTKELSSFLRLKISPILEALILFFVSYIRAEFDFAVKLFSFSPSSLMIEQCSKCRQVFLENLSHQKYSNTVGGDRVVRWSWVNFQCRASYNLDDSMARACCARSRCGWRLFGHFFSPLSFFASFSLSLGDGPI